MTHWMTAAGIALIAGGLATLICFRSVLFGSGRRRAGRAAGAAEIPRRAPEGSRRRSRRRAMAGAVSGGPGGGRRSAAAEADYPRGGLASIGLADEEDLADVEFAEEQLVEDRLAAAELAEAELGAAELAEEKLAEEELAEMGLVGEEDFAGEEEFAGEDEFAVADEDEVDEHIVAPIRLMDRPDRYGQRVDGWVRPEYRDVREEPPAGEYWTPIPVDLAGDPEPSAKGYGWPVPVERLPEVPPYEPATGFDLAPVVAEPTEVVPSWPGEAEERPGRIRLPRSWGTRNETWAARNEQDFAAAADEPTAVAERPGGRRRPRPRPRPDSSADRNTTVYVSRHAATEPPR